MKSLFVINKMWHESDVAFTHQKFRVGHFLRSSVIFAYFQGKTFHNSNNGNSQTKKLLSCGKFPDYNRPSVERDLIRTMKIHAIRSISALALAAVLAACGGGQASQIDQPAMTAVAMQSSSAAQVSAAMPAPDCAADGCKGLRIIDGNAEASRYDAMRRAAAEQAAGAINS
jgi:hypothetical protein